MLNLQKREAKGKNKVDKLRVEGIVPGVIYSKGHDAKVVKGLEKEILKAYEENGHSNIIDVDIDGDKTSVLFKEVQMHPLKNQIIHFDLFEIDMKEEITVTVPIVLENRDEIIVQPSSLIQVLNEVEVTCLPKDLPSEAKIDVVNMQIGDTVTVKDLDIYSNDSIKIDIDAEEVVATLSAPTEEVEEEASDSDAADVPTVSETEKSTEEE